MRRKLFTRFFIFAIFLFSTLNSYGQADCGCTNCPVAITDNGNFDAEIFIQNSGPDILGGDNCLTEVCFTVDHTWIGDLDFTLTAPDGTCYIIMGDANNNSGGCGSNCDDINICIQVGTGNPAGTGSTEYIDLNAGGGNCVNGNYTIATGVTNTGAGSACNSSTNNLDAFNNGSGSVSGVWTLTIGDNCASDTGSLLDWSLGFCDESGISCSSDPLCLINFFEANISACITGTGTYEVTGSIDFTDAPTSGSLIVEDCFGTQHVVDTYPFPNNGTVNYTIPGLPADGSACDLTAYFSADQGCSNGPLNYTAPTCPCSFTNIEANISACNPTDNTFEVTGLVEFINPPSSGQLIIEDCNGNQETFNAPFVSPINYALTGLNSDGTLNCSITATFTANTACTINVGPYNNPANCVCEAEIGFFSDGVNGDANSSNPWALCFGDELDISNTAGFIPSQDFNLAGVTYDPGMWLLVYDCPPSIGVPDDITTDPCLLGIASTANQAWTILNNSGDGTTLYFVPVTMYSMMDGIYAISLNGGNWCYDLGPTYPVTFLPEVTTSQVQDCQNGTATVTVNGGAPAVDGSQFTASNLAPANAAFGNTTANNGGTITITGLVDGDAWSFDLIDNNGCPIQVTGTFSGVEDPAFSYPTDVYCQDEVDPTAAVTGTPGGTFTFAPAGLVINATSGLIDLSASTPGTYTVTYTTPDPICFDQATFDITINPVPLITPLANQSICDAFTFPAINGTNLSGNQAYYTAPNAGGVQYLVGATVNYPDFTNYPVTLYIYDETGTVPNCFDEESFQLTINPTPQLNPLVNAEECDEYILPAITGTDLSGNEAFYTSPNGGGTALNSGDVVNTPGTTTYYIYDQTGTTPNCFDETSFDVTINLPPTFTLSPTNPTECALADGSIAIEGLDPNTTYEVTYSQGATTVGPANLLSDAAGVILINNLGAGTYSNFTLTLNGCTTVDPSVINLIEPIAAIVSAGTDQVECEDTPVTLTADNPDGANISWDNGVTDGVPFIQAPGVVTYTLTAELDGCTSTDQVTITINPFPIIDAGNPQFICQGDQVTLTANNPDGATLSWDNSVVDGVAFTPPGGTTTYTVTADLLSCISTDQVDVTVTPNPVFTPAGTNPSGCGINDGFIVLSGLTPGAAYTVGYTNNGNPVGPLNLIADASGQLLITGLSIGDYTSFVVADATSLCTGINDTNITLIDPNAPNIDAGTDQEVCEGIQVTLTASNPDGAIISWDNGVNDGVPFNQVVGTTTYTVTANLDNCISTDQVTVIVNPIPNVFAGNDVTVCLGDDVTLTASGAQSYTWDNGVTNGVPFIPTQTQTYTVIGTSQFGCEGTDNVLVTIETVDQVNFTGDNLEGCVPVTTNFTNTAPIAGSTCTWFISNGTTLTGCDNVAYTFTNPGCYDVTLEVTSANGCTNSFTQTDYVCVEPYPTAYFTFSPNQPTSINTEVEFTNGSIGANQYQWFFGDGASSNAVNPSNTYPEIEASYEIILVASSDFGCTDTATAVINIVEELIFYVPNTFTPDQDDFNPSFQPVFTSGYDPFDFHLMIFNRWGEIIFESFDASIGWDGTYGGAANGGELVKDGTYVWKIEVKVTKNDERKVFVGHVNVLK
ncbi:PKD domain-containing protein [Crocinitomicaceae bacterium]|nr:PKD domain-containing protein [Crocinitomicaceae bacterium]